MPSANSSHISNWAGNRIADVSAISLAPEVLVSDEARVLFQWVVYAVLLTVISCFGTVGNIMNIICFVQQGLNDSVNVSLLGLACSDCGIQVISLWISIAYSPYMLSVDLPYAIADFQYVGSASPYIILTGVSSWLTALITIERCLCIIAPLKVKNIVTPRRVATTIVSVFILLAVAGSPTYYVNKLTWVFSPERNRTILQLIYTKDRELVEQISVALNNVFIPFSAYVTIIICTAILVVQLRKKAKWRMSCTSPLSVDTTSERDQKVSKMVIVVSTLFIVCYSPICLLFITMFVIPELAFDGPNQNLLYILGGITMFLQTTNSSANIFIYYHMSSKYRTMFRHLICTDIRKK